MLRNKLGKIIVQGMNDAVDRVI